MKRASLLLLWLILISIQPSTVLAQSAPSCSFQPDGSISCTVGGGGGEGGVVERKVKKKMGMKIQPKQPVCRDNT